jgi:hypothetical protein
MSLARIAAAAALIAGSIPAAQAAPTGTLTFLQPSGTVGPMESIPVWMRLTIDPTSLPFVVDSSLQGFGVDPADVPADWSSLDSVYINTYFTCNATFTQTCVGGPPYNFEFNTSGPDAINSRNPFALPPGESYDYLFGSFVPSAGAAPAGTYYFFSTGVTLNLVGKKPLLDEFGQPLLDEFEQPLLTNVELSVDVARSCGSFDASCAFSRTVVAAIPEPETYAMMLAGLGLLGIAAARRRRAAAARR